MCGGDTFDFDNENENLTFEDYCSQQDGFFKNLLIECEGRIVLFNNTTRDKAVKYQQVKDLVTMVDQLPSKGKRYTNEHFKAAKNERNRLYVTASAPMIEKETLVQHKIILYRINLIQSEPGEQKKIDLFKQLLSHIENLIQEIETKDKGTGALIFLLENVQMCRTTVKDLIESCEDVIRERETIKTTEEKLENERSAEFEYFIDKIEKERADAKQRREEQMDKLNRQLENQERTYREIKTKATGNYFLGLSDFVSYLADVFGKIGTCAIIGGAVEGAIFGLVLGGPIGAIGGAIGGAICMAATASTVDYVLKKKE
ncbi:uncharacterized protein LOC131944179 [Physella acuta]|uniref:uncharacterized protein LOC131944179 n=1 Tax=Physella acuta TaxID=109671 RepID=UPI0027DCC01A|nr:uncharacterized protein LOC131944179 [Physella acuta]XP_059160691.1 uncharacterized protein LOC131944179 [Physella acuta]